ncbi:hypothetical protein GCM10011512_04250 [Tersicoccus solisilvae]|uniref:DnaJ homologue subfamily C member 28 conserved domain-containing protein n=1 Tax=Tersicoccus solisilvae TaxID=1882339 RepID=A0ABQ1NQU5_9MICC|nr:DUF1992 domain-containing protein [Tersicoccus solisilvae]GGC80644.1 hypothetical protein GCM10011512_04250 [Tersicoccus solisilvae]
MDRFESLAERRIREAMERGDFDDLPLAGQPLDFSDVDDPQWWIKRWMEREQIDTAALAPMVIQLRREADGFPDALRRFDREDDVRAYLEDYNHRVKQDRVESRFSRESRIIAPVVDVEVTVVRWRELG